MRAKLVDAVGDFGIAWSENEVRSFGLLYGVLERMFALLWRKEPGA